MPDPVPELSSRRRDVLEICVVIALGVLPHLISTVFLRTVKHSTPYERNAGYYIYAIATDVQIVAPLLWIMLASRRPWSYYGLVPASWRADPPIALMLALLMAVTSIGAQYALWVAAAMIPGAHHVIGAVAPDYASMQAVNSTPADRATWIACALYMLSNGVAEEFVLRAFLLRRIIDVSGSVAWGIGLVSALGASYHLYQGSRATLVIFIGEAVLCGVYLKLRRIWPLAIGHAVYDFALVAIGLWSHRYG